MAVFLLARVDLVKMSVDNNSYFQRGDDRQPPSGGGSGHRPRYLEFIAPKASAEGACIFSKLVTVERV